jgi:hypothetical protein
MNQCGLESNPNCTRIEHEPRASILRMLMDREIISAPKALEINGPRHPRISGLDGFRSHGMNGGKRNAK